MIRIGKVKIYLIIFKFTKLLFFFNMNYKKKNNFKLYIVLFKLSKRGNE